jgi:hypothetical protein
MIAKGLSDAKGPDLKGVLNSRKSNTEMEIEQGPMEVGRLIKHAKSMPPSLSESLSKAPDLSRYESGVSSRKNEQLHRR